MNNFNRLAIIIIFMFVISFLSGCGGDLKEGNRKLKGEMEKLIASSSQIAADLTSQAKKNDELKASVASLKTEIANLKKEVKELATAQANLAKANASAAKQPAPKPAPKTPTKKP